MLQRCDLLRKFVLAVTSEGRESRESLELEMTARSGPTASLCICSDDGNCGNGVEGTDLKAMGRKKRMGLVTD